MWDLSSQTRDQSHTHCSGSTESAKAERLDQQGCPEFWFKVEWEVSGKWGWWRVLWRLPRWGAGAWLRWASLHFFSFVLLKYTWFMMMFSFLLYSKVTQLYTYVCVCVYIYIRVYKNVDFPGGSDSKASACNLRDPGSIPGSGRSPGEGNGNPL